MFYGQKNENDKYIYWVVIMKGSVSCCCHDQIMGSCLCFLKKNLFVILSAVTEAQNKLVSLQSLRKQLSIRWPTGGGGHEI